MGQLIVHIRSDGGQRILHATNTVHVGRAPDNDLVLADAEVSWRHALIYEDAGALWVRDLDSRNGTLVDGQRITSPTRLSERGRIRIGPVDLQVRRPEAWQRPLLIEECGTGVQHPLVGDRFVVSAGTDADLQHPGVEEPITLMVVGDGEVRVGHDGDDSSIELGESVDIRGFCFRVVEGDAHRVPTAEATGSPYFYALTATLDGATGPEAIVRDRSSSAACHFTAETRAILLYTLGRQLALDREAGLPPGDEGWVQDQELIVAVWGRTPPTEGLARLKTLLHRVRTDCRTMGLSPWCIEKRRGHTRVRVQEVSVT